MRRKLTDLMQQRTAQVNAAETALAAGNREDYNAAMERVNNLNTEIQDINNLIAEQDRQFAQAAPSAAEQRDMVEDRVNALRAGNEIRITAAEVYRDLLNSTTVATGTIAQPTGAGSEIHDPVGNMASSIVDQVRVVNLNGMGTFLEPYVKSELTAQGGKVETVAGTARTATDPTFGVAEIKPYELNVTSYVDRNIARLSPANYYQKIHGMAMRAMRSKLAGLIVNGDGEDTPTFHGITTAKNKAGENIFATLALGSAIAPETLDALYFAYGSDEAIGANARLLQTKANLKAFGALRGTNEKRRLLDITPDAGNPNTGIIKDGGVIIPYTLQSDVGAGKLLYGDPMNYELGVFGDYVIRLDESVKAVERMTTILGDVVVGGNLIVDKGFVVGTIGG